MGVSLTSNMDNIEVEVDLFGNEVRKLSMMDRIGFVPLSIWQPDWGKSTELKEIIGDKGDTRELVGAKMALPGSKYTVSIFNPHLAMMILSAYCPPKAKIYDAFGGGGTRGFIAAAMGHEYTGVELRQEEVDRILNKQAELRMEFDLHCADSRTFDAEKESYDFSYSCPPYYDLEVYSKLENDCSNADTYEEFLGMLEESLKVTYDALKPGAMCVWTVGNFRDKRGDLTHFSGDVVRMGKKIGFHFHDELIWWGASGSAALRAGQFEANLKSVRVHENIIIFRKSV